MVLGADRRKRGVLARFIHGIGNCMTQRRTYVRQNVAATFEHVPRSGERSYTPMNNPVWRGVNPRVPRLHFVLLTVVPRLRFGFL